MTEKKKDPIEGFHFTHYDAGSETLTIEIHPSILGHAPSIEALQQRVVQITGLPGVKTVVFVPRKAQP